MTRDDTAKHKPTRPLAFQNRLLPPVAFAIFFMASGCDKLDPIRVYTVERPAPSLRMLGAILPREEQTWFFKVMGPNSAVASCDGAFRRFVESIHFEDGEPDWNLPEGWVQQAASRMRFATLRIETITPPLELSVIPLPNPPRDPRENLLANINRWRGQLSLGALSDAELDANTTEVVIDAESELVATLVEFEGEAGGGGGGMSRMATPRAAPAVEEPPEITYDRPEGWTEGQRVSDRGGIRIKRAAVLNIADGEQRAEVSVTQLGSANRLGNVNRWRSTVGLTPISAEELEFEKIEFAGAVGDYSELIGPQQAILGVIAEAQNSAWFVKLQGPHDLVLRERDRFKAFVTSIQLQGD